MPLDHRANCLPRAAAPCLLVVTDERNVHETINNAKVFRPEITDDFQLVTRNSELLVYRTPRFLLSFSGFSILLKTA